MNKETVLDRIKKIIENNDLTNSEFAEIIEELTKKPYITVAHITTGKYNIFCKIRAKGTEHAREIIFSIDDVEGVLRTETMISLEESINDKKRLMKNIFQEL